MSKIKREYELVSYDCVEGKCLMIHEKSTHSKLAPLSLDHKSIGERIINELNELAEENNCLKQRDSLHILKSLIEVVNENKELDKDILINCIKYAMDYGR